MYIMGPTRLHVSGGLHLNGELLHLRTKSNKTRCKPDTERHTSVAQQSLLTLSSFPSVLLLLFLSRADYTRTVAGEMANETTRDEVGVNTESSRNMISWFFLPRREHRSLVS